ncbi:hypothetical protein UFB30_08920 [Jeotgalibacillus sp. HH7-29]|uniref:Peptidase M50 domain-containing protein n=2 Tax=Jeotgalibacillus haloalkalitolerans TaxID=3104292 RepID=A0ABU5KMJ0_9BACL|nr:hypothetical protein [Jeotgalibacillus sp. HH7-29]
MLWVMAMASFLSGQFLSFFVLFVLVLMHEAAHAMTAVFFRWEITKLTLLPFGGQLIVKKILNKPVSEELAVIISGPLLHLLIHLIILNFQPSFFFTDELYHLNLQLLLFNLLPVWPLDGGRICYCIANLFFPFKKSIHISIVCSLISLIVIIIHLLDGLQFQWMLLYLYTAVCTLQLYRNRHMLHKQFLLEKWGENATDLKHKVQVVEGLTNIQVLVNKMYKGKKQRFILLNNGKMIGNLSDVMIIKRYFSAS